MLNKQELAKLNKLIDTQNPRVSLVFKVLGDANRCSIFRLALKNKNKNKDLCVADFAQILKISSAAVSQHLKQLEMAGVLLRERRGQNVYYKPQTKDPLVTAITKAIID